MQTIQPVEESPLRLLLLRSPAPGHERMAIFAVLLCFFLALSVRIGLHADESQWIAASSALERLLEFNPSAETWKPGEVNLTQPPLGRYLIAIGRLAGGFDESHLNRPWNFAISDSANLESGNVPSMALLYFSRLPMTILAAGSMTMLFGILCQLFGRLAGYSFLIMILANPLIGQSLSRAMGEAPLTFFLTIGILCAAWQMNPGRGSRSAAPLLSGACAGLAASCKLNGGMLVPALLAIEIAAWYRNRRCGYGTTMLVVNLLLIVLTSIAVFCALNPFLYLHPIRNSALMYEFRLVQFVEQQAAYPQSAILSIGDTLRTAPFRIFGDYAPLAAGPLSIPLNAALTFAGVLAWAQAAVRDARARPLCLAILALAVFVALPAAGTPLDWDRYYFLPVLFAMLAVATALAVSARRIFAPKGTI